MSQRHSATILAGDIGGTKTVLALYRYQEGRLNPLTKKKFASKEYADFSDIVNAFLKEAESSEADAACFGIAGPVIGGRCKTTNLPWEIEASRLKQQLSTENLRLLNDLEATAYGMLYLSPSEFVDLNPQANAQEGNRAIIAAGTGLGEAMLFFDGTQYHPVGSEGGHCDFAPADDQQSALLAWLRRRYPDHVSYERVLSGPGLYTLYEFLRDSGAAPEPAFMKTLAQGEDRSAMISEGALQKNDPLCRKTLNLFASIYGAEAGNLALTTMATGGVYIGGGIAPKILPSLESGVFMKAFLAKGRFRSLLSSMPVKVARNPETALVGAARFAADRLLTLEA
jgi:glucokinase